jgi:hypothetical protein
MRTHPAPATADPHHTTTHDHAAHSRSRLSFLRHYVEMVVAMFVGMAVLSPLTGALLPALAARSDGGALLMATDMAIGMAAWMRIRRHSWVSIARMTAAMYLPFVVLLIPYWAGAISGAALMTGGHVLMFPAMAIAMLPRRNPTPQRPVVQTDRPLVQGEHR